MLRLFQLLLAASLLWSCGSTQSTTEAPQEITFEVLSRGKPIDLNAKLVPGSITVYDVYADWCAPCKQLDASLKDMKRTYGDRLVVYKLDLVDWESELAKAEDVNHLPFLIVYGKDGSLISRGPSNQVLPKLIQALNAG